MEYSVDESCTSVDAHEVKFKKKASIDLQKAKTAVVNIDGELIAETPVVIMTKISDKGVSIYASGRILVKDADKKISEEIAGKLVPALESEGAII